MPRPTHPSGKPFVQKPPRSTEQKIMSLEKTLVSQVKNAHWTNALSSARKLAQLKPASAKGLEANTIIPLLLILGQFKEAKLLLEASPGSATGFSKAYTAFKLGDTVGAAAILTEAGTGVEDEDEEEEAKTSEEIALRAIVAWTSGKYAQAAESYEQLSALPSTTTSPVSSTLTHNADIAAKKQDFISSTYRSYLIDAEAELDADELEENVPSIPTQPFASTSTTSTMKPKPVVVGKKPRNKLPKNVRSPTANYVPNDADKERWLPLRLRTAKSGSKGGKESGISGFGVQGSSAEHAPKTGGGGGGGGKGKGKKGRK